LLSRSRLAVEQQAEPVLAREVGGSGMALHLEERIGHGGHAEHAPAEACPGVGRGRGAAQALGQRVDQHCLSFQW
jgi:hypothetical protein